MRPPYYESRYIRANHRNLPRALWLRETRLLPTTGPACADVWVMLFDPDGAGNRAIKRSYPIDAAQFDDWTVRIADTTLDDHHARGDIGAARWDLTITPGGAGPVRLLTERAYQARIPTAKTTVRDPLARFDGLLELDTTLVDLDGWAGSVNHNWGTRHPAHPGLRLWADLRVRRTPGVDAGVGHRPRRARPGAAAGRDAVRIPARGNRIRGPFGA